MEPETTAKILETDPRRDALDAGVPGAVRLAASAAEALNAGRYKDTIRLTGEALAHYSRARELALEEMQGETDRALEELRA